MEETDKRIESSAGHCVVCRQDDHGNRFVVATQLSREAAERMVALYEQRGHKQHYWVEAERGAEDNLTLNLP